MKQKRTPILLVCLAVSLALAFLGAQVRIPKAFALPTFTQSNLTTPSANTCAGCHSGTAAAGGSAVVVFPGSTYTPGVAQHLSVTITDPTHARGGFQLTTRQASSVSTQAGSFTATDTNTTVVANGTVQDLDSANAGILTWNFDWTPPTTSVGNVNFYLTGLATGSPGGLTTGNGIYQSIGTLTPAAAPAPDFGLSASPTSVAVAQGASGASTITVTPQNAFSGSVSLSASGLPAGVTASFSSASTTSTSTLTLAASSTATPGTSTVTITGTSGSLTHTATVSVTVNAAPNFTLSASPTSVTVVQGASGTSTITVTPQNAFSGSVALSASGVPTGVTASFSSASTTSTSTLTLAASSTATPGTATVTITGTSGSLTHTATVSLTVNQPAPAPDFTLSAFPTSVTVVQGASGTSTVTVTPQNAFSGSVALSASGVPVGVTASFSSPSTSSTSTLTLAASSTATTGTSTVTITGTSGSLTHTATVSLTVNSAPASSPTLSVSPATLTFNYQTGSAIAAAVPSQAILVTGSNPTTLNFTASTSGEPWLSISPLNGTTPAAVNVTVTPGSLQPGSYTGTVTITSTGATGSPQTVRVTLVIAAPTGSAGLTASPSSLHFYYERGGVAPAPQMLTISSTSSQSMSFSASASGGSWLTVSSTSGKTPGSIMVSANPAGLMSGTYTGAVRLSASSATAISVPVTLSVSIDDDGGGQSGMYAMPYVLDPTSSGTLNSLWIDHLGVPSSTMLNHPGLVLSKNTSAPSGSQVGATIQNIPTTGLTLTQLGFDYRDGGQCTATSPRFVVVTTDSVTHVVGGCSNGTIQNGPMIGWKRVRFNLLLPEQTTPPITPGMQVKSITLILDQGPETGVAAAGGLVVIDNIDINGKLIGK